MEGRKPVLRELSQLQKDENPPAHLLHIGFNQRRKPHSFKLKMPMSDYQVLTKKQQEVMKQLRDIDQILQRKNRALKYHKGYLFCQGISHSLPSNLAKLIVSNCQTVEQGFSLWRLHEEEGAVKLIGGKLSHSPPNFSKKLTEKSIQKIGQYDASQFQQSANKVPKKWEYFSKPKHLRIKTQGQEPRYINNSQMKSFIYKQKTQNKRKDTEQSSVIRQSQFSSLLELKIKEKVKKHSTLTIKNEIDSGLKFSGIKPQPSIEELQKMLLKENRIISMWVPPPSCAQLIAVFSIQIFEKQVGVQRCHILKYFIARHNINKRFFSCLYDFFSAEFNYIDQLILTTSKTTFDDIFRTLGWKIQYWLNNDKVRICFTNTK